MSAILDAGTWDTVADVVSAVCLLGGSLLSFSAGMGLLRFPDLLARMHSATKPQVLGLILMLIGLALRIRSAPIVWMLVLVVLFQMLTSPVAAHMVSRAGYRTGKVRHDLLVVDELTRDLRAARTAVLEPGPSEPGPSVDDRSVDDRSVDDDLFADVAVLAVLADLEEADVELPDEDRDAPPP